MSSSMFYSSVILLYNSIITAVEGNPDN